MSKLVQTTLGDVSNNFDNVRVPLSVKQREKLASNYRYYGAQGVIDYVDGYLFDGEYILVAEDGENLKSQKNNICNYVTGKFWVNNHAHIINASNGHDTKYLYYKLSLVNFRNYVTGSAQPKLTKDNLNSIVLYIHKEGDQRNIAAVLSALDAKIDCNNRINAELETMAKTLYDYWFVQFDFPDANGKPYKSSGGKMVYNATLKREIPEGWSPCELSEIISRSATGLNPRDNFRLGHGENYYVTIKNVSNGKIVLDDKCDRIDDETLNIIDRRSQLQPGDVLFTSIEPVGVTYLIQEKPTNWNINESVFTIRPNYSKATSEYLFLLLSSSEMKAFTKNSSSGSIHKGIRHGVLKTFKLAYSNKTLIDEFSSVIEPILKRIDVIDKENQHLTQLRDWLLPMLMNGQVTVA